MIRSLIAVIVLAWPFESKAWEYDEHAYLSAVAWTEACTAMSSHIDSQSIKANANVYQRFAIVCGDQMTRVGQCFGHLVAIAGDHTEKVDELVGNMSTNSGFLLGENLDCTAFPTVVERTTRSCRRSIERSWRGPAGFEPKADIESLVSPYNCRLVPGGLGHQLDYLKLLTTNGAHFQPSSYELWQQEIDSLPYSGDPDATKTFFAGAAFALHYLEDSFAAGHLGLDRENSAEQDYGNAYHDDFNGTGRFLQLSDTNDDYWYGYGDKHLTGYDTFYLTLRRSDEGDGSYLNAVADELSAQFAKGDSTGMRNAEIREALEVAVRSGEFPAVLSIPIERFGIFNFCFYMDNCEKLEIVVVESFPSEKQCTSILPEAATFKMHRCERETFEPVRNAAVAATTSVLASWIGDADFAKKQYELAGTSMPTQYRALKSSEENGRRGGINKSVVTMEFDPGWNDVRDTGTSRQSTSEWGLSIEHRYSDEPTLEQTTVAGTLRLADLACSLPGSTQGAGCGTVAKGRDLDYPGRLGVVGRLSLVDSEGNAFDSLEFGALYDDLRIYKNVVGLSPKVSLGAEELWSGSSRRNIYGAIGASLDVHAGKHVFHFDLEHLWHNNDAASNGTSLRFMFGCRVMSIDLDRKR